MRKKDLSHPKSFGLLLLRIGIAGMMIYGHGWNKLINFQEIAPNFPDPFGLGSSTSLGLTVFAEFFCSLAVLLGLLTRFATIPLIVTMLMAAFYIHGGDPWAKKEFALLYAVPFLCLLFTGPGTFSLDHGIQKLLQRR